MVLSSFRQVSWHLNICKFQPLEVSFPNCSTGSFHLQELPGNEQVNSVADISHVSQAYKEVPSLYIARIISLNYRRTLGRRPGIN